MASTIPAVLDELLTRARLALPGVQILDGGPTTDTEPDVLALGFTGSPGEPVVEAAEERAQLAASPDRERYDVTGLASAWIGDDDAKKARDRAFELLETFATELRRDSTLGGLVLSARLAVVTFAPEQTSQGAVATIRFAVRIDAFTR